MKYWKVTSRKSSSLSGGGDKWEGGKGEWEGEGREERRGKGRYRRDGGKKRGRKKKEGKTERGKGVGERKRMQKEMDGCWPCSHRLLLGPRLVLVQCSLVARLSLLPGNEAKYSGSSILCVPILINV